MLMNVLQTNSNGSKHNKIFIIILILKNPFDLICEQRVHFNKLIFTDCVKLMVEKIHIV